MNKDRRKELDKLQDRITAVVEKVRDWGDVYAEVCDIRDALEAIKDEENDGFQNLSEGLQAAERGQAMEEAVRQMEEGQSTLDELSSTLEIDNIISELESAFSSIEEAKA